MEWINHGERIIYDSPWVRLTMADVEIPGVRRFDHHVVRATAHASGVVMHDTHRGVLLLWRHRFVTDTWGWEIPAGRIDDGESAEQAGEREAFEETGWRPGPLRHLTSYYPTNGLSDATFHIFVAAGATHVGEPTDPTESERVEWLSVDRLRDEIRAARVTDGLSLTALTWWLQFGLDH